MGTRRTPPWAAQAIAVAIVSAASLDASTVAAAGWELVEPMPAPRLYHASATVGGRWYVAGGENSDGYPSAVDMYDPSAGRWSRLGDLIQGRKYLPAIVDKSGGLILFAGGFINGGPSGFLPLRIGDLVSSTGVLRGPSLLLARYQHAGALAAGKFVVAGGWGGPGEVGQMLDNAEALDPLTCAWTSAGTMPAGPRTGHSMTTLNDGSRVLVVGGGRPDHALSEVDLFDAAAGQWSAVAPLTVSRARHKALLLGDGRVLVAGGFTYPPTANNVQTSVELFDPTIQDWTAAAPMTDARYDFDMVLLPDGRVLVAGGSNNATDGNLGALASAEIYDPSRDRWTSLPLLNEKRLWPVLAVLSDGVYVAGGMNTSTTLASVERLAWSDLGITGPIDSDAGVPDASPPSARASCGSNDAGAGDAAAPDAADAADAAPDASQPTDAVPDAPQPTDAVDTALGDAGSSDRETRGGKRGCSCGLGEGRDDSFATVALACVLVGGALAPRRRQAPRR